MQTLSWPRNNKAAILEPSRWVGRPAWVELYVKYNCWSEGYAPFSVELIVVGVVLAREGSSYSEKECWIYRFIGFSCVTAVVDGQERFRSR